MKKHDVVVITGSSSGLGKLLALRLAKQNLRLALVARNETELKKAAAECRELGSDAHDFVCDIRDAQNVTKTINAVVGQFGTVDVLVNNAGIWLEGPTTSAPHDKVKDLFATNTLGHIYMTQAILPLMKKKKRGQILNVISDGGLEPGADWGIYSGTKYAMRGFTDSLRLELAGTGIKVMGFYPGGMDTDLFVKSGSQLKHESWMMDPNHVADILVFMLNQPDDMVMGLVQVKKIL